MQLTLTYIRLQQDDCPVEANTTTAISQHKRMYRVLQVCAEHLRNVQPDDDIVEGRVQRTKLSVETSFPQSNNRQGLLDAAAQRTICGSKGNTYLPSVTLAEAGAVMNCRRTALVAQSSLSYSSITSNASGC